MENFECRACRSRDGRIVLDLGQQPASDYFPKYDDPGPDPVYPLQMWLCASCGLAQLLADPTVPEEPRGAEPAALVNQARDAVDRVAAAGLLPAGARVAEYGSPHGGSWLGLLAAQGLRPGGDGQADVIVDCFGMMHAADQAAAIAERAARLAPGATLLLQYHSLSAIVAQGQWNALRHGHYAYYSTTALTAMLTAAGLQAYAAWEFSLYGGTVLLAAAHPADAEARADGSAGEAVRALLDQEAHQGITRPDTVSGLQREASAQGEALREWLTGQRALGRRVLGYSAASRAVALLRVARRRLLPAIADASPGKRGLRMPGTGIPVISPQELISAPPDAVLVFVPDLIAEVSEAYPQIEAAGAAWVDISGLSGRL